MKTVTITGWKDPWTVEALMRLLEETHDVKIGYEKKRWTTKFTIQISGPDEELCAHRLTDFAFASKWKASATS